MIVHSILDGFYEEIMARVAAKVPRIKHFDHYMGQYEGQEVDDKGNPIGPAWNRPAEFLELPADIKMEPLGLSRKVCNIIFTIHIVSDVVQDVSRRETVIIREKGHEHTGLVNDTQMALEGFNGNQAINFKHFGRISYVGLMPYLFNGPQIVHKMGFSVRIVVDAAKKFYTKLSDLAPPIEASDEIAADLLTPETL